MTTPNPHIQIEFRIRPKRQREFFLSLTHLGGCDVVLVERCGSVAALLDHPGHAVHVGVVPAPPRHPVMVDNAIGQEIH